MGIDQFGVTIGLINEASLGTWFISERLQRGCYLFLAGRLLNAPSSRYLYTFVAFTC
jgi:hypothetical protein